MSDAARRAALRARYDHATAALDPPLAIVDLDAFDANADALVGEARTGGGPAGKPLRVASKSVRSRALLRRVLGRPGWRGVMSYALGEAIWLVRTGVTDDVLVAYPTADRAGLAEVAGDPALATAITLMVDSTAQLDLIDAATGNGRQTIRVCLDLDASWRLAGGRVHVGVRRSPVHTPAHAGALAREIAGRAGFRLVGLMSYEAQVAGLADAGASQVPGRLAAIRPGLRDLAVRAMQRWSLPELLARRAAAVAAVRRYADLEFVNGGGTGSVAATAADPAVTEVTAGSGLYGPALFDAYRRWRPTPAAFFAVPVVRRPHAGMVTVFGGGWIGSGETSRTRQPTPWLPAGLRLLRTEGAGEVQTPVAGPGADRLRIGDRVWFRHAKAGELAEHVNELHLVAGDAVVDRVPSYRGEGQAFG